MTTITEVERLASLTKLRFTDEELANFANQLTNIMQMINILQEVDCSNVEPLTSVSDMHQRLRVDKVTINDISDKLFTNISGPQASLANEIKCFIVPKVIE